MPKHRLFIGYCDVANILTLLGVTLALGACYSALTHAMRPAITMFIASGLCDLFDGAAARRLKRSDGEKKFGIELDTAADVISFAAAPAVLVFARNDAVWYILASCVFFVLCGVTRLAWFNASIMPDVAIGYYIGLPVTYTSLILPISFLLASGPGDAVTLFILGLLFIANVKIPKPRGVWYVIFPIIANILIVIWWLL